jgi:hypothetical protein
VIHGALSKENNLEAYLMTDLNRKSAEIIMGWHIVDNGDNESYYYMPFESRDYRIGPNVSNWTPLTDMNQCMMVVDKMRELGWAINLSNENAWGNLLWTAECFNGLSAFHSNHTTPNEAILTAALEAKGKEE